MHLVNQSNNDYHLLNFHSNDYAKYFPFITSFNPQICLSSFYDQGSCVSEKFHKFTEATQLMQANIQTQGMSDTKAYALLTLHTLSLYREHKLSLEKSCRNSLKSQGTFLWQGTYNYSYSHRTTQLCFWRQPMKTRTLKGRLCHQIFSSQTYTCLYNGPFTYQSVKSILRRVRHTCGIYIVIGSFMASKPHRLELNLKNLSPDFFWGITNLPKDVVLAGHKRLR